MNKTDKKANKLKRILDKIFEISEWWLKFDKEIKVADKTYGIDLTSMHEVARVLSAYNVYLASMVAEFKRDYNRTYIHRKINISKRANVLSMENAYNKAKSLAEEELEDVLTEENTYESMAFEADIILKHSYRMLDQIQNSINYLRKEYKNLD